MPSLENSAERTDNAGIIPLSVPVHPLLAEVLGYSGKARFVSFQWEPCGDELWYDDGRFSGTAGNPWAFLSYRNHPAVAPHLEGYNLGYSDLEPEHALLLDRQGKSAGIATVEAARAFVKSQYPPSSGLPPEKIPAFLEAVKKILATRPAAVDMGEVLRLIEQQRQNVHLMLAWLDAWPYV